MLSENETLENITTEQPNIEDCTKAIREEWLEMMKPMIYKRLEWVVERISDFDTQWTNCKHGMDNTTNNINGTMLQTEYYDQNDCNYSQMGQYFVNKYL